MPDTTDGSPPEPRANGRQSSGGKMSQYAESACIQVLPDQQFPCLYRNSDAVGALILLTAWLESD